MNSLIPSDTYPNGLAALGVAFQNAQTASAAVAFVTEPGVKHLADLLRQCGSIELDIVARAGGVTTPEALQAMRDKLGAEVSVVIGRDASRFHPKLWLARSDNQLSVLSGSGNLTDGGLLRNDEQFELSRMPLDSEQANQHEARFAQLTAGAYRLEEIENTTIWSEWQTMITKLQMHRKMIRKLEDRLDATPVHTSREDDRRLLLNDLYELYNLTVARNLKTKEGRHYVPSRFKQGIDRARDGGDPVQLVYRICRHQTKGFNVILDADEPLLTVESLVVDESKPYHDLFGDSTREISAERLEQFPSWLRGK